MARRTIVLQGGLDGTRNQEGQVSAEFYPGHMTMRLSNGKIAKHSTAGGGGDFFFAKENYFSGPSSIDTPWLINTWSNNHRPNRGDIINARIAIGVALTKGDKLISAGDGTVAKANFNSEQIYQSVAASANVTNTVTETAFDKTTSIPANSLRAGDQIKIRVKVVAPTTNSTDTLTIRVKIGSTTLVATGAVDVADNDVGVVTITITVRTIGASGTIVATAQWALGVLDTATFRVDSLGSTAIDTTAAQAVTVTAQWSVASASNIVRLDDLAVDLERASLDKILFEAYEDKDNSAGSAEAFAPITVL